MCGIAGILLKKSDNLNRRILEKITNSVDHRGPDSFGYWSSNDGRIHLGHRRLSIIDLSNDGDQPMISSCGRYVITFNGEIYNFKKLRNELIKKFNINFKNKTDTIVLLELISRYGLLVALKKIEGMFAFGLWDKRDKKLHLVRDRLGEKPLFYFYDSNVLVFGSELKTINEYPKLSLEICKKASFYYSILGYVPAPLSIYKNTFKVMPAQVLTFSNKGILKKNYFEIKPNESTTNLSYQDHKYNIKKSLEESVKKMMVADVEIGCFLSGGVDSSLVALMMQKNASKKIKTFSVGFLEKEYDESNFARLVADKIGTNHYGIKVKTNDMFQHLENMVKIVSEPFSDSSIIPTYLISKLASSKVKVVLSGDGGDEIFLGYNRYKFSKKIENLKKILPSTITNFLSYIINYIPTNFYDAISEPFQKSLGIHGFSHKMKKLSNILNYKQNSDFYMKLNLFDNSILKNDSFQIDDIFTKYQNMNLVDSVQNNDLDFYLSNDILVKVDRASMANSLEVRCPFLNHNLVNAAFAIPLEYKMKNKITKYILKDILSDYMPKSFVYRPKMGFAIPIEKWINDKKFKKKLESIFFDSDWNKFGWERRNIINKWLEYKKYRSLTPQCIWMYAMSGLWLDSNRNVL